jgi:periplasmic copper chaperone A
MLRDSLVRAVIRTSRAAPAAAAAAALVLVTACGGVSPPSVADPPPPAAGTSPAAGAALTGLTLQDAWVKASPSGATSLFGILVNPTDHPVTVAAATSPASNLVEFHEIVRVDGAQRMRVKVGGFVVNAHGRHSLHPGGDHIMLIGLRRPVLPGDTVATTLLFSGEHSVTVNAVCKDFAGGNEEYSPPGRSGLDG